MSRAHCGAIQKAKWNAYYKSQPATTQANFKLKMIREVRRFPENKQLVDQYVKLFGADSLKSILVKLPSKARKRAKFKLKEESK